MSGPIRVAELFAGVGGFRLGLEYKGRARKWPRPKNPDFKVIWSNQWEPPGAKAASKSRKRRKGTKRRCNALTLKGQQCKKEEYGVPEGGFCRQHRDMHREGVQWASDIYVAKFGPGGHSNEDINDIAFNEGTMVETIREKVPEHELLVGGFPCQDYSVARTKSGELGIKGEKGKLWIPIRNIIREMRPRPKVVLLENVPRLLNSPANARGLNFAIILNDLISMGYEVEWRVINAADYGMPQQRSRVFILAYRTPGSSSGITRINGDGRFGMPKKTPKTRGPISKWLLNSVTKSANSKWKIGPFAEAFPVTGKLGDEHEIVPALDHQFNSISSPFGNCGYAWNCRFRGQSPKTQEFRFWSTKVKAGYDGEEHTLGDVLVDEHDPHYEIDNENGLLDRYAYMKGEQKEWRIRKEDADKAREIEGDLWELYQKCTRGYRTDWWAESREDLRYLAGLEQGLIYDYTAGAMAYPDLLDNPSRTVVTAEIGKSVSRMRHVIEKPKDSGNYRGLMPIELERLNQFPDNWTAFDGISDSKRGFLMGNALVVGVVTRLAGPLAELIRDRSE